MKIEINKHEEYTADNPKTIISCSDVKEELILDKDIDNKKVSKFLFDLLEKNEDEEIELFFDEEKYKNDKFLIFVKELFNNFIKGWNDSVDKK